MNTILSAQWKGSLFTLFFVCIYSFAGAQCSINARTSDSAVVCGTGTFLNVDADWEEIDIPNMRYIRSIAVPNANTIFMCGDSGTLYKSTNQGNTFSVQPFPKNNTWLNKILFTTSQQGFVFTDSNEIYKTVNGGNTWNPVSFAYVNPPVYTWIKRSFNAASFPDSLTGYAGGGLYSGGGQSVAFIHKTTDGGNSWSQLSLGSASPVNDLFFIDSLIGFAACQGGIYKTINGGISWINYFPQSSINVQEIKFMNKDTGFASFNGAVMISTNQGLTWSNFNLPVYANSINFNENKQLYVLENGYNKSSILQSSNFGKSWSALKLPNTLGNNYSFYQSAFDYNIPGLVSGYTMAGRRFLIKGASLDSVVWWPSAFLNDSQSRTPLAKPIVSTTYFVSAKIGNCIAYADVTVWVEPLSVSLPPEYIIACGESVQFKPRSNLKDTSLYTYNWTPAVYLSDSSSFAPVANAKTRNVYHLNVQSPGGCKAQASTLLDLNFSVKTQDSLNIKCGDQTQLNIENGTWTTKNLNLPGSIFIQLRDIASPQADTMFLLGGRNLWRSADRGQTWDLQTSGGYILYKSFFRSARLGFIAAFDDGPMQYVILKTSNGNTWQKISLGNSYTIPSLWFTSDQTGFAIGNPGKILKSINGGTSWIPVSTNSGNSLNDICFTDPNTGYAVGTSGTILKTSNSGSSWTALSSGITSTLNTVYFINADTGFAGGGSNTILKTTNGGISWSAYLLSNNFQVNYDVKDIQFINSQIGYAVTNYSIITPTYSGGAIFETLDGGLSWKRLPTDSSFELAALTLKSNGFGMAVGGYNQSLLKPFIPQSYVWNPAISLNNYTLKEPFAFPRQSTLYTVTGYIDDCWSRDTVYVGVSSFYTPLYATKDVVCGDSVKLEKTNTYIEIDAAGYGNTWEISDSLNRVIMHSLPNIKIKGNYWLNPGTYTVKLRPKLIPPPLYVKVIPMDGISVNSFIPYTSDTLVTLSFKVNNSGNFTNLWTPAPVITGPNSGTQVYKLQITAANGCTGSDSLIAITKPLLAESGSNRTLVCGSLVSLDTIKTNYTGKSALQLIWSDPLWLQDTNSFVPKVAPVQSGFLKVTLRTLSGCTATDSVWLQVNNITVQCNDTQVICKTPFNPGIQTNYTGSSPLQYSWYPPAAAQYPLNINPNFKIAENGVLALQIRTWNNCTATDSFNVQLKPASPPSVCLVSVDNQNKNQIIWNKNQSAIALKYMLYRETNVSGIFSKIAEADTSASYILSDTASRPDVQSNKYLLQMLDVCGIQTQQGNAHKTMHLTINKGTGNTWNLIWNAYEGFTVNTYNIYRGTDSSNLQLIGTSAGSNTSYSDLAAPAGTVYYQVEIISPNTCDPGKTYNSSRSNMMSSNWVGLMNAEHPDFIVYPNPVKDRLNIIIPKKTHHTTLYLYNMQGTEAGNWIISQENTELDLSHLKPGIYVLMLVQEGACIRKLMMKDE